MVIKNFNQLYFINYHYYKDFSHYSLYIGQIITNFRNFNMDFIIGIIKKINIKSELKVKYNKAVMCQVYYFKSNMVTIEFISDSDSKDFKNYIFFINYQNNQYY